MYLRHEGDSGFSTQNPDYAGPKDAVMEFCLSNGQPDEYAASRNITAAAAMRALEFFFANAAMAPWLLWREKRQ